MIRIVIALGLAAAALSAFDSSDQPEAQDILVEATPAQLQVCAPVRPPAPPPPLRKPVPTLYPGSPDTV